MGKGILCPFSPYKFYKAFILIDLGFRFATKRGGKIDTKDNSQAQRRWVREEVCLLVTEYFRTKSLSDEEIQNSHEMVSRVLRNREIILTGQKISDIFRNMAGIKLQSAKYSVY